MTWNLELKTHRVITKQVTCCVDRRRSSVNFIFNLLKPTG